MPIFALYKKYRIYCHIGFWLGYLLFFTFTWVGIEGSYSKSFFYEVIQLPSRLVMVCFGLYYLMPAYLLTKQYGRFLVYLVLSFLVVGILQSWLDRTVYSYYIYGATRLDPFWDWGYILRCIVRSNSVFAVAAGLKILSIWLIYE